MLANVSLAEYPKSTYLAVIDLQALLNASAGTHSVSPSVLLAVPPNGTNPIVRFVPTGN